MTEETPISYAGAAKGTPVLSSSDTQIGTLEHVLAVHDLDMFEGIVIATHHGIRFIDADHITQITTARIRCSLTDEEAASLAPPDGPPVYHVDALDGSGHELHDVIRRLFGRTRWKRETD
ncbi:MAG TPA: hypothetical protein VLX31_18115 [Streptosporangiaceae bacterium]|nr:hypothetical protein [Streptosporangiaceae bacterium]